MALRNNFVTFLLLYLGFALILNLKDHRANAGSVLPTLRDLSLGCAGKNESQIFCVTHPKDCEKTKPGYPCELMTVVSKYDLHCIKSNLKNPYIRTICSKRHSTFLVTLYRSVTVVEEKRSCKNADFATGRRCVFREYVGVGFTAKPGSSAPADDDVFYICTADDPHVTTWTAKGVTKIPKWVREPEAYKNPYQTIVFKSSGVGVYWEDVGQFQPFQGELICEFIISVEDIDMEYTKPQTEGKKVPVEGTPRIPISLKNLTYLQIVQGMVNRTEDQSEIERIIMDDKTKPGDIPTDFKLVPFDKALNLSVLKTADWNSHGRHLREVISEDEKLRSKYWDPVFTNCRNKDKLMCYVMDPDPDCLRENKESCQLIIAFQFQDNFKELLVKMLVDDWPWGGFAFSEDRKMGDEVGFYCQFFEPSVDVKVQVHLVHSSKPGNDTDLLKLLNIKHNITQISGDKRYCEWTFPTSYNVSESPFYPEQFMTLDLIKNEYALLVAVGNNQRDAIAYHTKKKIMPTRFSKKIYLDHINSAPLRDNNSFLLYFNILMFFFISILLE